jgi:hypothetical protein
MTRQQSSSHPISYLTEREFRLTVLLKEPRPNGSADGLLDLVVAIGTFYHHSVFFGRSRRPISRPVRPAAQAKHWDADGALVNFSISRYARLASCVGGKAFVGAVDPCIAKIIPVDGGRLDEIRTNPLNRGRGVQYPSSGVCQAPVVGATRSYVVAMRYSSIDSKIPLSTSKFPDQPQVQRAQLFPPERVVIEDIPGGTAVG